MKEGGFTGRNTGLEAIITEEALNTYIQAKFPELEAFSLIRPEQVALEGRISILKCCWKFTRSGNFAVSDQRGLFYSG